jgi:hypothetical protein
MLELSPWEAHSALRRKSTIVEKTMPEHLNMSAVFPEKVGPSRKNQRLFHLLSDLKGLKMIHL